MFCCKSCATTYNNKNRSVSEETKQKISEKLQKRNPNFNGDIKPIQERNRIGSSKNVRYCIYCGNILTSNQTKYCSTKCQQLHQRDEYIKR